jgi:acetyltransferase-like isoleucine patch superfamily enzyme
MNPAGLAHHLLQRVRAWRVRHSGVRLGPGSSLGPGIRTRLLLSNGRKGSIVVGADNRWEAGIVVDTYGGSITIGPRVFLGPYVVIYGHGGVEIGEDTLVSMHCRILSSDHAIPPVTQRIRWAPDILKPTRIGHDVWLGAGVTVLGGVTIGDGCVVGAGAVVTRNLPAGSIAHGVPARVVRQRPA